MKSLFLTAAEDTASNLTEWWNALTNLNLNTLLAAVVIFLIGYMLIKWVCKLADKLLARTNKLDPSIRSIAVNAGRILLLFLLLLTCADKLGLPTTSIITLLGTFGLAFSLAMQNSLSTWLAACSFWAASPLRPATISPCPVPRVRSPRSASSTRC